MKTENNLAGREESAKKLSQQRVFVDRDSMELVQADRAEERWRNKVVQRRGCVSHQLNIILLYQKSY